MNIVKAQKCLSRMSVFIAKEGAYPAIGGKVYVAVVLTVLLYSLESWVWTFSMFIIIHGFYHCAYQQLTHKKPRRQKNGTYKYYLVDKAMEVCKSRLIQVYIVRRRQTILVNAEKRPIYKLCREAVRSPGTPTITQF